MNDQPRSERPQWIHKGGGREWYVAAFRCMECHRLPTEHEWNGVSYICTADSSRWVAAPRGGVAV